MHSLITCAPTAQRSKNGKKIRREKRKGKERRVPNLIQKFYSTLAEIPETDREERERKKKRRIVYVTL